nr:hypothetical protein BaRGS_010871 [Batillaria attramentaria]
MAARLTDEEQTVVQQFLDTVNNERLKQHKGPVAWSTAIKFCMARKFDVKRAIDLFFAHETTREREDLQCIDPDDRLLQREITTEKFTVLPGRDRSGAALALFTARLHYPPQTTHQIVLKGLSYQLDAALESSATHSISSDTDPHISDLDSESSKDTIHEKHNHEDREKEKEDGDDTLSQDEQFEEFIVYNNSIQEFNNYSETKLILHNTNTGESREITHLQFTSWPDYGVPPATGFLDFLFHVRSTQEQATKNLGSSWTGHPLGPPIVVHCSAGIGRTGTFITIDICLRRLEDIGTVDIPNTVRRIRSQRAFSIQMPDQYVFCHLGIIEHAMRNGLVKEIELISLEDSDSESD